jgi:protease-4
MKLNKLASAISRGLWLIEPRTAAGLMPMAARFLNGEKISAFIDNEAEMPSMYNAGNYVNADDDSFFQNVQSNSVLIIPICGAIMKDDYCGEPGTDTMSEWFKCAVESPNIAGIVLKINSGGGSVEGTGEFADLIKASTKPVIAYTDGIMASAAYWLGCSAKEIFASHKTVEVGSIGTAISFYDNREAMKQYGYKQVYINADSSPDKNQDYFKALDGDFSGIKLNCLNPTNDIFMKAVQDNRDGKLKKVKTVIEGATYFEPLTGKMYLAESAIEEYGLIDKIGSLQDAVDRVLELAA